jgi:hypothetical protein
MSPIVQFIIGVLVSGVGYLIHRSLLAIDHNQREANKRLYNQGERLRTVEKNQALERQALDAIHDEIVFVKRSVERVDRSVKDHQVKTDIKIDAMDSMARKNQESLGKIILIMKKWILKK